MLRRWMETRKRSLRPQKECVKSSRSAFRERDGAERKMQSGTSSEVVKDEIPIPATREKEKGTKKIPALFRTGIFKTVWAMAYLVAQVAESDFTFLTPKVACGPLAEIFSPPPELPAFPHRRTWWPTFSASPEVSPVSS